MKPYIDITESAKRDAISRGCEDAPQKFRLICHKNTA